MALGRRTILRSTAAKLRGALYLHPRNRRGWEFSRFAQSCVIGAIGAIDVPPAGGRTPNSDPLGGSSRATSPLARPH
jgi:hypothetical protein